jgi:hypothetical protein
MGPKPKPFRTTMRILKARSMGRLPRSTVDGSTLPMDPAWDRPLSEPGQVPKLVRHLGLEERARYEAELRQRRSKTGR